MKKSQRSNPNEMFWKDKKVLVTGHTGFKGSWLSLWLLKMNAIVSGISLNPDEKQNLFDQLRIKNDINHIVLDLSLIHI